MKKLELSTLFLGPLDANDDENLAEYFVELEGFRNLTDKNLFVVIGAKGTGKSAIKQHLVARRSAKRQLVVELDDSFGFSVDQLGNASAAEIKNKMKSYLVTFVISHLVSNGYLDADQKSGLNKLQGDVPLLKKVLTPLKLKAVFVEYAIGDLFPKKEQAKALKLLAPQVIDAVRSCLVDRDIWVVLDDIDTVFTSEDKDSSLRFVEGLLYAASDICIRLFKRDVWVVLLLRSEIYEELLRNAPELDKEILYIWEIVWDGDSLASCLGERIRWALDAPKGKPCWKYWEFIFEVASQEDALNLQRYCVSRSMNGPRDLLLLVDLARMTAVKKGAKKIELSHIQASEYDYGKKKIRQIVSNFQRVYPDVDRVLERLFRGKRQEYTRKALEKDINDNLLTNREAREAFKGLDWLVKATPFLIVCSLYRIGCIGYWDASEKRYIYALEKSDLDQSLPEATRLRVHDALSEYLELCASAKRPSEVKKKATKKKGGKSTVPKRSRK